ncbi:lipopolysaccharide biosynthesis protein [Nonomuraea sp. NPDC050663]|uniref:lipopolysaccharide biosynthesis protein n=1 Tax=Nonomuraea sp. NPDC050663 TaxID=3364370 RepID=UPI0037A2AADF
MTTLAARLRSDLRNPLFLQGYALMANTGITAVLGLGYWMLATRLYSAEAFGEGQALIAAMRLFASLTGLAFVGVLARFIPLAGRRTGELIVRGYMVAGAIGLVAALGFLLTLPIWGPAYSALGGFGPGLFFLAAVLVWTIFTLQDVALTGLRRAVLVPVNSMLYGLVKMGMLVGLAGAMPGDGIFVSWVLPTAMAVIPINWLILRRWAPAARHDGPPPTAREVGRFLAGDFPGALSALLVVFLVPVLVAAWLGDPRLFGYFSVAHSLGCMLCVLTANMAVSLTVESSGRRDELARNVRATLRRTFTLVVPVVLFVLVGAPTMLGFFGAELSAYGTPLLRLMALAVLPGVLIDVHLGTLRATGEAARLAVVQIGQAVLVLGSVAVAFPVWGIAGVGYAIVGSQLLVAALVLPRVLKDQALDIHA